MLSSYGDDWVYDKVFLAFYCRKGGGYYYIYIVNSAYTLVLNIQIKVEFRDTNSLLYDVTSPGYYIHVLLLCRHVVETYTQRC